MLYASIELVGLRNCVVTLSNNKNLYGCVRIDNIDYEYYTEEGVDLPYTTSTTYAPYIASTLILSNDRNILSLKVFTSEYDINKYIENNISYKRVDKISMMN